MEYLIVFAPLIGAMIAGLNSRTISPTVAESLTSAFTGLSALCSIILFIKVTLLGDAGSYTLELMRWIEVGTFKATWSIHVDSLTTTMLIVVTGVSTLVHIYSIGYMHHDLHRPRFMSYLSLFTFFMIMLVTSADFIQLFLGWEGVGLCSYLLIGFWYKKPSANAAAIKAFVVNRVGDFGMSLGIFAIFMTFGSVAFADIFPRAAEFKDMLLPGTEFHAITVICGLLFIGAMGKSAQLGLHTWLPDAMEGPTPVSALIHAATMVTAGVFLVARCSYLFEYAPEVRDVITIVGATTAVFAASIALVQNDIKKIIAYSTCSQLGYMFFACGVSAYSAGVFHLMTHGFFKALLFLCAGSVIHAMSEEQNIQKMGGIWKHVKVTYVLMLIGSLAIAGLPPFAGFYSKDAILESAFVAGTPVAHYAYWMGIFAAFCTAFYSWRLLILTFHGKPRASHEVMHHIHESPKVMLIPLFILATGAVLAGFYGYHGLHMVAGEGHYWGTAIFVDAVHNPLLAMEEAEKAGHHALPLWAVYMPLVAGLSGIFLAYVFYLWVPSLPGMVARVFAPVHHFLVNKWYVDELYDALFVRPAQAFGMLLWKAGDVGTIDRFGPNGLSVVSQAAGGLISRAQSGYLYHYAFAMLIGLVALIGWFVW
ncbi:MAG: NADH:ubiquinone oxidoreductase subunit 5 [Rickettsiales bacterium]|jgi:NADH-quinone oxidoreductase subunit L|nr:NADH:ubiquinone oxidoreductase subunit 5 [Rickettsiales bacterium]